VRLRDATPADAIANICAPHALHGIAAAEEFPPAAAETAARMNKVRAVGLPYIAAEQDGAVSDCAYLSPYHARAAYRLTVENAVYDAVAAQGQGICRALLAELIACADALGLAQMVASISA
jgi:L-amino acid N-acyltransferase YncA